jgi:hypothetical protein
VFIQRYVSQPSNRIKYLSLFQHALDAADFSRFDAAVAYATVGGVEPLCDTLEDRMGPRWQLVRKRWLVGIDWCRTETLALDRLASIGSSRVRVPYGADTVARRGCTPRLPFHPKVFILSGEDSLAVIMGSGNLSRNGLTKGHEVGSLILITNPTAPHERQLLNSNWALTTWFGRMWAGASPVNLIRDAYIRRCEEASRTQAPTPTDDDSAEIESTLIVPGARKRGLSPEQLRMLRTFGHLWIHEGRLTRNRSPLNPGDQIMLSRMTRVFFGFPAKDVHQNTAIGHVAIMYGNIRKNDCSLRFSDNSMDVLTLPVPGAGGPATYDYETLLFTKKVDRSGLTFDLALGTVAEIREWKRRSATVGGQFQMTSGREWGVF